MSNLLQQRILHLDTGADGNYPIDGDSDELWDQSNVQLALPMVSSCCQSLVIEYLGHGYCSNCAKSTEDSRVNKRVAALIAE